MVAPELSFKDSRSPLSVIGSAAVAVVVLGIGWYLFSHHKAKPTVAVSASAPPVSAPAEDAIEHPLPHESDSEVQPLPELSASDTAVHDALIAALGVAAVTQFLVPDNVIRHTVVTVDNMPRQKVAVDRRPVVFSAGAFLVDGDEDHATLDPRNYRRYDAFTSLVGSLDVQRLAAVYLRFYPLFQKSYQDLGYPNGYFNDRLVKVIDMLLAAPQPNAPIALARPNVMYLFADPGLESLPAGQKLLIRMGSDNAAVVKAKLKELRAIITANAPKR